MAGACAGHVPPGGAARPPDGGSLPGLVTTEELVRWQAAGPVVVIDVRTDVFAYLKGHLPGAEYLNTETLRASEGGIPTRLLSAGAYAELFSAAGRAIRPCRWSSTARERSRNIDATFLAWLLAGLRPPEGVRARRRVLQVAARAAAGGAAVSPDTRDAVSRRARFSPEQASLEEVQAAVRRAARSWWMRARRTSTPARQARRCGAATSRAPISHYWQGDLTQEGFGHVWKPAAELRRAYEAQGITPDKDIIAYCNSATEASHVHFTLRYLLGYPRVRIYVGSWTEWAEDERLPVATGRARGP